MEKEIRVIVDTEQARVGLLLAGNITSLYKNNDDEILNKAIEHVGPSVSQFGFKLAPQAPVLNTDIEKQVSVKVNTKVARKMLGIAGFKDLNQKSDDEIFEMALAMASCYGVTWDA